MPGKAHRYLLLPIVYLSNLEITFISDVFIVFDIDGIKFALQRIYRMFRALLWEHKIQDEEVLLWIR